MGRAAAVGLGWRGLGLALGCSRGWLGRIDVMAGPQAQQRLPSPTTQPQSSGYQSQQPKPTVVLAGLNDERGLS